LSRRYPIVVPSKTPQHISDTRRARAFDEPEFRLSVIKAEAYIVEANGGKRVLRRSTRAEPIDGYMRIEDLMNRELANFEDFFVSIVKELIALNFKAASMQKAQLVSKVFRQ
jgi:hypothetical protein